MINTYRPGVIAYEPNFRVVLVSFHSSYLSDPHNVKLNSSGLVRDTAASQDTLTDLSECRKLPQNAQEIY